MPSLPYFGAICRSKTNPCPLLILDPDLDDRGEYCEAVRLPASLDFETLRQPTHGLAVTGEDLPAARILATRRRAMRAFEDFETRISAPAGFERTTPHEASFIRTAMILCAGLGTRLRPLTSLFPKPALPFFGAPLLRYTFALLKNAGIERVVVNTHHLPDTMEAVARQEATRLALAIDVSREEVLQDTAGGLREARALIGDEPFLLVNGDAFICLDLPSLIARHRRSGALASLAVAPPVPGESFRAIESDASGRIVRIRGIGPWQEGLSAWHFLGVHVLEPTIFDAIPAQGPRDINGEVYPALIARGAFIEALPVHVGAWADLGTPRRYFEACEELLTGLCDLTPLGKDAPVAFGTIRDTRISGEGSGRSFVDRSAVLEDGVTLEAAIVGPDVRMHQKTHARRSILLAGARIDEGAHIEDAIVWSSGQVSIEK